jgi:hypothetical protein
MESSADENLTSCNADAILARISFLGERVMDEYPVAAAVPAPEATPEQMAALQQQLQLEGQMKGGASWFYWIAALSAINSILLLSGVLWSFFIGLGITQVFSQVASEIANEAGADYALLARGIGFVMSLGVSAFFLMLGTFANRGHIWAFILGMVFYGLDGLIFLAVQDFPSFGFHLFALFCIFTGLKSRLAMNKAWSASLAPVK